MPQPRLGTAGLVALLVVANAIVPFSLDIYTPSVPQMPAYFDTTVGLVNLTIVGFFLFFAVGLLVCGPMSDRLGRRPVLLGGVAVYAAGSAVSALSPSIYWLIGARAVQAVGAGAVNAVSTALVKDCFTEKRRGAMLAVIQVMAVTGPVLAPLLGGLIIQVSTWRATFWVLTVLGLLCLAASLLFVESLPAAERTDVGVLRSLGGLGRVARDRTFMLVLAAASLFNLPFMAYIAVGSYIYVDFFGETQQVYTYFFAATAAVTVLGPMAHLRFGGAVSTKALTYGLMGIGAVCGVLLCVAGVLSAWFFAALFALFATVEATVRPYTTNILLSLRQSDVGSASSMINCVHTLFGVVGMALIMLPFPNYIVGLGVLMVASMTAAILAWAAACRRGLMREEG